MDGYNDVERYAIGVEVKTNKVWIDSQGNKKPVYRKVIVFTFAYARGDQLIPHNVSNFGDLVKAEGTGYASDATQYLIPYCSYLESEWCISIRANATNVILNKGTDAYLTLGGRDAHITIEYTKTN